MLGELNTLTYAWHLVKGMLFGIMNIRMLRMATPLMPVTVRAPTTKSDYISRMNALQKMSSIESAEQLQFATRPSAIIAKDDSAINRSEDPGRKVVRGDPICAPLIPD